MRKFVMVVMVCIFSAPSNAQSIDRVLGQYQLSTFTEVICDVIQNSYCPRNWARRFFSINPDPANAGKKYAFVGSTPCKYTVSRLKEYLRNTDRITVWSDDIGGGGPVFDADGMQIRAVQR